MVELTISIGIIATSIILIVTLFSTMFKSSQHAVDLTAGTVVAESELDRYIYENEFFNAGTQASPSYQYGFGRFAGGSYNNFVVYSSTKSLNNVTFIFDIYSTDISSEMVKLDIVVWWWQNVAVTRPTADFTYNETTATGASVQSDKQVTSPGAGVLRTELSRLVVRNPKKF
jgi:hypothetical protein